MNNYFLASTGGKSFIDERSTSPGADLKPTPRQSNKSVADAAREQMQIAIESYSKSKTKVTVRKFNIK